MTIATWLFAVQYINSEPEEFRYSYYDRTAAVDYALEHALDEPEFYSEGNSDCANFVSKCKSLNL